MQKLPFEHWHGLADTEVIRLLETDLETGLGESEVARRQQANGPNVLTRKRRQSLFALFLSQVHQPLIYILLGAALLTAFLEEWIDASVILGVVALNGLIGFVQESRAVKTMEALARSMDSEASVIRAGRKQNLSSTELVPGDIVLLKPGDKVPADLRLITCRALQVDESAMTGESVPVEKTPDIVVKDTLLADRRNMGYSSTLVTYGNGKAVVVATGDKTEVGRINELIASADILATPLTRKIARFSAALLWIILGLALVIVLVGVAHGATLFDMFMTAVALAVSAVPEGLPAVMTITLAIGVARMAKRRVIIRKLPAVETLGSTTVICTDKTGTLTQNRMTVQTVMAGGEWFDASGVSFDPEGQSTQESLLDRPHTRRALLECLSAGALCNDARLVLQDDRWISEGDPTEGALLVSARNAGVDLDRLALERQRLDTMPFESELQLMATLHDRGGIQPPILYVKGAVEQVAARCINATDPDLQPVALDTNAVNHFVNTMTAKGMRVLAFARREFGDGSRSISSEDVNGECTFLGLQAMIDPPRPEAIDAVRNCQAAGIHVKMITGDHPGTAAAIARQIGLNDARTDGSDGVVINGQTIATLSAAELKEVAERIAVFARVAPEQKLRLVEALQANGHIVAMTGDGVNDAPALRQANIGIAMGMSGTEVAKEAADMVLTDDNFYSIEAAVEEGRGVFDNLVKFITWTLPTNVGEGLVILVAVFAGLTLPILPLQILWINMTTTVLMGVTLAFEPREPGIMTRRPRDQNSSLLTRSLVVRILLVGFLLLIGSFGMFEWQLYQGESEMAARTATVNVLVFGELFYLLNCRSLTYSMFTLGVFSNLWLLFGVITAVIMQLLFTYSPVMQRVFQTEPISVIAWLLIVVIGMLIYGVVGIEKWSQRRPAKWV